MNGEKVVKIILSKPIQRILNINFKLPRKKEKINKKRFFYKIRSDLFGKKITILKRKNEIEIFKQNWNFDTFLIKKKIQINFKKKCSCLNTSQDGNILIVNFSKTVQLWKIFPRIEKFLTKNFDLNGEINQLNFSSKKGKNIAIITTTEELLFFDTKENILIYYLKIKIFAFVFDYWEQKFAILSDSFFSNKFQNTKSYYIFSIENPIPVLIISSHYFQDNFFFMEK